MGFVLSFSGDPAESLAYLRGLSPADLGNDRAGIALRDFIAQGISECSAALEPHQVYDIRISGDSSGTEGFKFNGSVQLGDRLDYVEPTPAPLSR